MAYELKGTIKQIGELQTFASGFQKREFVVTDENDRYPQDVKFEAVKERANALDNLREGDDVQVSFDVRGNEYNGKYYVNLVAWKIIGGEHNQTERVAQPQAQQQAQHQPGNSYIPVEEEDGGIPF